jgi:ribosomal protein S18 acetylase RimI-like enzyme
MVDDNLRNLNQLTQEQWRNSISDPQTLTFVYQDDEGRIVGLARGRMEMGKLSHLGFIGVVPEGRRKGTGQTLLASFIEESTRRGSHKISLSIYFCEPASPVNVSLLRVKLTVARAFLNFGT